jgi:hypothetical protein
MCTLMSITLCIFIMGVMANRPEHLWAVSNPSIWNHTNCYVLSLQEGSLSTLAFSFGSNADDFSQVQYGLTLSSYCIACLFQKTHSRNEKFISVVRKEYAWHSEEKKANPLSYKNIWKELRIYILSLCNIYAARKACMIGKRIGKV